MMRTVLVAATATLMILPAAASAQTPSITTRNVTVAESATSVKIPITLSRKAPRAGAVNWSLKPGTAGADYAAATSGKVKFKKNARNASITVRLTPDAIDEPDETFTVTLSRPVRAKL